jgi:hypothetical protein
MNRRKFLTTLSKLPALAAVVPFVGLPKAEPVSCEAVRPDPLDPVFAKRVTATEVQEWHEEAKRRIVDTTYRLEYQLTQEMIEDDILSRRYYNA